MPKPINSYRKPISLRCFKRRHFHKGHPRRGVSRVRDCRHLGAHDKRSHCRSYFPIKGRLRNRRMKGKVRRELSSAFFFSDLRQFLLMLICQKLDGNGSWVMYSTHRAQNRAGKGRDYIWDGEVTYGEIPCGT